MAKWPCCTRMVWRVSLLTTCFLPLQMKRQLIPLLLTVFIDMLGLNMVIPVMAPFFLEGDIISGSLAHRSILLGFLLAVYPIMQFFGSPYLGALSDRHGRKPVLVISLIGTTIGYLIMALGVMKHNLVLLFLGRALDGFTGGNLSTAQSAISDISTHQNKTRNFGLLSMVFGIGLVIGPFVGGKLSDGTIHPLFTESTPFFFAAALALVNTILVKVIFIETLKKGINSEPSFLTGMRNVVKAFTIPNLRAIFLVVFIYTFGFNFFTQFFNVYLIDRFSFSASMIGDIAAYQGIWIAIVQGTVVRPASRIWRCDEVMSGTILALALVLFILILPSNYSYLYLLLPLVSLCHGLTRPNALSVVSDMAGAESQGEIMGINQSVQSLAMAIPPIIAGFIVSLSMFLPMIVSGSAILVSWLVFVTQYQPSRRKFHEVA